MEEGILLVSRCCNITRARQDKTRTLFIPHTEKETLKKPPFSVVDPIRGKQNNRCLVFIFV